MREIAHGMSVAERHCVRILIPSLLLATVFFHSALARADLAPPDSDYTKAVTYTFTAHGAIPTPDKVVFAYGSTAAPTVLAEGTVVAVERNQWCQIYVAKKADYEAWSKANVAPSELLAKSIMCNGGPSPVTTVSAGDPRSTVNEDVDVKVDATSCSVTSRGAPTSGTGGCTVSGGSRSVPLVLLLGIPAVMLLLSKRRRRA